jgi:hypothetical protein
MMARFTDPMNLALSILLAGIFLLLPVLLAEMVIILPLAAIQRLEMATGNGKVATRQPPLINRVQSRQPARCTTLPAGELRIPRDDGMEY